MRYSRLLAGIVGLIAALLSVALPVLLLVRRAQEAEFAANSPSRHAPSFWMAVGVLAMAGVPAVLLAVLAYRLLGFSLKDRGQHFRWANAPLAVLVGTISGWMLYAVLRTAYWDYYLYPKLKASEGYIYPQYRYTIFDIVTILWCIVGLAACVLLTQNALKRRAISGWSYRTVLAFFVLFGVLVIGVAFGSCIRSMGF